MPSGELINASERFEDRRRQAEESDPFLDLSQSSNLLARIQRTYESAVQPTITILETAGYTQEAIKVSQLCTNLIWQSRNALTIQDNVQAFAELELKKIDPVLYAIALRRPDLSE